MAAALPTEPGSDRASAVGTVAHTASIRNISSLFLHALLQTKGSAERCDGLLNGLPSKHWVLRHLKSGMNVQQKLLG